MPLLLRQPRLQRYPRLFWRLCLVPPPQIRYPVHVHVDADAFIPTPRSTHAQICHFRADAREGHQALDSGGYVGAVRVAQDLGGGFYILSFVVMKPDFRDQYVEVMRRDCYDRFECEALS